MIWRGAATGTAAAAGAEAEVESGAGAEAKVCAEALAVASPASSSTACAPKGTVPGGRRRDMHLGETLMRTANQMVPLFRSFFVS